MNKKTIKTIFGISSIYFSSLWIFTDWTLLISWKVVSFYDLALLKLALISLFAFIGYKYLEYSKKPKLEPSSEEIEGVPREELISFIWKNRGFPANEAVSDLGITTPVHSNISKILKSSNVIIKNPKNKNKLELNSEYSREDLADCFYNGSVSTPFKIIR